MALRENPLHMGDRALHQSNDAPDQRGVIDDIHDIPSGHAEGKQFQPNAHKLRSSADFTLAHHRGQAGRRRWIQVKTRKGRNLTAGTDWCNSILSGGIVSVRLTGKQKRRNGASGHDDVGPSTLGAARGRRS